MFKKNDKLLLEIMDEFDLPCSNEDLATILNGNISSILKQEDGYDKVYKEADIDFLEGDKVEGETLDELVESFRKVIKSKLPTDKDYSGLSLSLYVCGYDSTNNELHYYEHNPLTQDKKDFAVSVNNILLSVQDKIGQILTSYSKKQQAVSEEEEGKRQQAIKDKIAALQAQL